MAIKRAHGEGSIYKRPFTRADGTAYERWVSEADLGYQGGKRIRKTVYGKTRQEVKVKLDEIKRQLAQGTFVDSKLGVGDYLEAWLKEVEGRVKPRTTELYTFIVNRYIKPRVGHVKLIKLAPLQVQEMVSGVAQDVGVRTANQCRTVLGIATRRALELQLIARNPVAAVKPLREEKREIILWTPHEASQFLKVASTHRLHTLFYLALATGMRRGELLGLRWGDIGATFLHVRQSLVLAGNQIAFSTPKTAKGQRCVTLTPDVVEVLEAHRLQQEANKEALGEGWPDTDLVFTTQIGTPIHPRNLERTWYTLREHSRKAVEKQLRGEKSTKALKYVRPLPLINFHGLRHFNVSMRIKQGQDAKVIADQVGHARASFTLDVYTHLFDEQRQAAGVSLLGLLPEDDKNLQDE